MSAPFCKDCAHFSRGGYWSAGPEGPSGFNPATCKHPTHLDLVTGGPSRPKCADLREQGVVCGIEGALFEQSPPRSAPEPQPRRWWQVFG